MSDQSDVSASQRSSLELPPDPTSAGRARAFVTDMLALWDCDDVDEIAGLLTSEVVTNAIRHAGGELVVEVSLQADTLRVSTTDLDPLWPQPIRASPHDSHGRGLLMVDSLARRWGVESRTAGKVVWFEVSVRQRR
jgi:anti-sigma regulatory factor (Ser/Thr protein kinase)